MSIDKEFTKVRDRIIQEEMDISKAESFPNKFQFQRKVRKLKNVTDPNKFIVDYKKITGATDWDLPKDLRHYKK
uniref:Uncharacterized protein n=1 Tax=viral metagenome TaxID=1070528 RepID=A0A6M3X542_9ZZZZ